MNTTHNAFHTKIIRIVISIIASGMVFSCMDGSGTITTESREISSFTHLELTNQADVSIFYSHSNCLSVKTDENLLSLVETDVSGSTLRIESIGLLIPTDGIEITIATDTMPESFSIPGSGTITWTDPEPIDSSSMEFTISGSGAIQAAVQTQEMETDIPGSGAITLSGSTDEHDLSISGSGSLNAFDLVVQDYTIHISGSGSADVYASDSLEAYISGSGSIVYQGNPTLNKHITGSGDVDKE